MDLWVMIVMAVLGLAAIMLEIFVPAGGLLGTLGGLSMVAAIVLAYHFHGIGVGSTFLAACLILAPLTLWVAFKLFPHSPVGRRLIMNKELSVEAGYQSANPELAQLEGQEGEAITMLRPAGMARFGGKRVNVVADGELIEKGEKVRVTRVEGGRVVVERV